MYRARVRLWHSVEGREVAVGEEVDLSHLEAGQIEMLKRKGYVVEEAEPEPAEPEPEVEMDKEEVAAQPELEAEGADEAEAEIEEKKPARRRRKKSE